MSKKKIVKSDEEWKKELTDEQYRITRQKGTEPPFTGKLLNEKRKGIYYCVCCKEPLFESKAKYDSGTGWPSFTQPISKDAVDTKPEIDHDTVKTEVLCAKCSAHLGHVFEDGPVPTGMRYCIDSEALEFEPVGYNNQPPQ